MPLMVWSDEPSFGIRHVDEQHQKLVELRNDLFRIHAYPDYLIHKKEHVP